MGASPTGERIAGKFDRSALVLGSDNETVLKRAVEPQLIPVYGTDFRSTPVFFMQDDHDYFDNDDATDEVITFPPPYFSLQLARATQSLFYPEFLPDRARPPGLPWSSAGDRFGGVSETFGTVRYGRLAEILMYDIRGTQTRAGPSAGYLDGADQAGSKGVAVGAPGNGRAAACSSRHGRRREADRAARFHHRGFCARQDRAADVQVGREDAKRRGDRQPRSVPHRSPDAGSVKRALGRPEGLAY